VHVLSVCVCVRVFLCVRVCKRMSVFIGVCAYVCAVAKQSRSRVQRS